MTRSLRVVAVRTATLVVAPMLTAVMLTSAPAHAAVLATTVVSAPDGSTDATANDEDSRLGSVSADGRYVAFESGANNLSAIDNDDYFNIFVRDVDTNATTLVSAPTGTDGTGNNDDSFQPSISADGRYVAFSSGSDNLSVIDNDDYFNIFVRDMTTNTTTLVSVPTGTDGTGNNEASFEPSVSADGRYISFMSNADDLAPDDNSDVRNVYLRDTSTNATILVSAPDGSTDGTANNASAGIHSVSANGRYVAFESSADDLAPDDNSDVRNAYLRDTVTNDTILASAPDGSTDGTANNGTSGLPSVSADGRYVAFVSAADDLAPDDNSDFRNIYLRDTVANSTTLVSAPDGSTDGTANNEESNLPTVSGNGRYVAFTSEADDLAPTDNSDFRNVYLRDTVANVTTLVSAPDGSSDGSANNATSDQPSISPDGQFVVFDSFADDLAPDDNEIHQDVYLRHAIVAAQPVSDSDGDGLTDAKEASIGGNPNDSDTDNDGLKDGTEYLGFTFAKKVTGCDRVKRTIGKIRTSLIRRDSDGDGLNDRLEVFGVKVYQKVLTPNGGSYLLGLLKSSPVRKDTDGDGLRDKVEVTGSAAGKFNFAETDPANCHTDFGRRSDGYELARGKNPVVSGEA